MLNSSYRKKDISELVTLAQKDDNKAIEALIKATQKHIFATLSYLMSNTSKIPDLTQNILIKMIQKIKTLKDPEKFKPWLNKIISNSYYDELRKEKAYCECISLDKDECKHIIDLKTAPPIEKCATSELDKLIKDFIVQLPTQFKIAIILREFAGLSYQEIANITNVEIGTVKSRISRARNILQNQLRHCI